MRSKIIPEDRRISSFERNEVIYKNLDYQKKKNYL
jgi:hypothetical protein